MTIEVEGTQLQYTTPEAEALSNAITDRAKALAEAMRAAQTQQSQAKQDDKAQTESTQDAQPPPVAETEQGEEERPAPPPVAAERAEGGDSEEHRRKSSKNAATKNKRAEPEAGAGAIALGGTMFDVRQGSKRLQ